MTRRYLYQTDAVSGWIAARTVSAAVRAMESQGVWAHRDSLRESQDIRDGAWLRILDANGVVTVYSRGPVK